MTTAIDVMLPRLGGYDLCRGLRRTGDVPIIIVTARCDSHDVVAGFGTLEIQPEAGIVYGYLGDGRLVDVHVRRLRRKIEADPVHPRHLVTVQGLGYKLQP